MDDAPTFLNVDRLLENAGWARALARRLVDDEQHADDVVQTAWLAALQRPPSRTTAAPGARAWLARVIRNVAWKQHRASERRETRERAAAVAESQPPADSIVAEIEAQRLVADALLRIDEPCRETLVRRWVRDEKPAAIARAMAVPVRTVETRLARGLERLRAELTRLRGGDRRAWGLALVPLAVHAPAAAGAGVVLGTLAAGAGAMSMTAKLAAAALVVAAATIGSSIWSRGGDERGAPARSRSDADPAIAAAERNAPPPAAERAPLGEAAPPPGQPSASGSLRVRAIDAAGNRVLLHRLLLFRGEQVIGASDSSAAEELRIEPFDGEAARLFVDVVSSPARIVDVPAGTRELEIRLPRGRVLSGTFWEGGRPLDWTGTVIFSADRPFAASADVPDVVRRHLGGGAVRSSLLSQSDEAGRFRFEGLDEDVGGHLFVPSGWSTAPIVADVQGRLLLIQSLRLERPEEGLRVELFAPPTIEGRLVTPEGAAVERFRVTVRSNDARGFSGGQDFVDGRFRLPILLARVPAVDVDFLSGRGSAFLRVEGPFSGRRDLGEIRLERMRTLRFRLIDDEGRPIERAYNRFTGPGGAARDYSFGSGGEVTFPESLGRVRFGAFGHEWREFDLPAVSDSTPIEVVLPATTTLAVKCERADGEPLDDGGVFVELAFRGDLLGEDATATLDWIASCEGSRATECQQDASGEWRARFASLDQLNESFQRGIRVFGLAAGMPFHVRLRDMSGTVAFDEVVTLRAQESRVVVARCTRTPRLWKGRVLGPAGEAVAGATIELTASNESSFQMYSGSDGTFSIEAMLPDAGALQVTADGYARFAQSTFRLPEAATETTLRLERAWPLVVAIVDAAGRQLDGGEISVIPADAVDDGEPDESYAASRTADGRHQLLDLPPTPAIVRVDLAGARYEVRVAPPQTEVRVDVPRHGSAIVRYDLPIPDAAAAGRVLGAIELERVDSAGPTVGADATIYEPPRREGVVEFEFVLPGRYQIVLVWTDEHGDHRSREPTEATLSVVAGEVSEAALRR